MKNLNGYVMGIIAVIILSTISGIFLSDKKIGKFLNYIFSSIVILMIITPVAGIINGGFDFNDNIFAYKFELDANFIDYTDSIKNAEINNSIKSMLKKNGYRNVEVKVLSGSSSGLIKSVSVNLSNLVIDTDFEHINKYDRIASLISDYLDIEKGAIVYE